MILELCKAVHCVDLDESFETHIYLENFFSIQPRTSPVKFAERRVLQPAGRSAPLAPGPVPDEEPGILIGGRVVPARLPGLLRQHAAVLRRVPEAELGPELGGAVLADSQVPTLSAKFRKLLRNSKKILKNI